MTRKNKAQNNGAPCTSNDGGHSAEAKIEASLLMVLTKEAKQGITDSSCWLKDLLWFNDHPHRSYRLRRISPGESSVGQGASHVICWRVFPSPIPAFVRELRREYGRIALMPRNRHFRSLLLGDKDELTVFGVVTAAIHQFVGTRR